MGIDKTALTLIFGGINSYSLSDYFVASFKSLRHVVSTRFATSSSELSAGMQVGFFPSVFSISLGFIPYHICICAGLPCGAVIDKKANFPAFCRSDATNAFAVERSLLAPSRL